MYGLEYIFACQPCPKYSFHVDLGPPLSLWTCLTFTGSDLWIDLLVWPRPCPITMALHGDLETWFNLWPHDLLCSLAGGDEKGPGWWDPVNPWGDPCGPLLPGSCWPLLHTNIIPFWSGAPVFPWLVNKKQNCFCVWIKSCRTLK